MTSEVIYLGDLRTKSTHIASQSEILSDAPIDNNGKGEAFSPTDYVANALASCMLTIMGIKAREMNVDISQSRAEVTKIMQSEPRRIGEIEVKIFMSLQADIKTKTILENAAKACPVAKSLHPDIVQKIEFIWKN
ncbi:OsmC family protein [Avrilella dinanensis]|uniref:Osmotically inducible protein OsmC n=1 Tax=Avrilella dinanensis TaxID=2008672 RepID=A0A2M9R6V0_9FLAO|nr:OsmC family protein [Avrilella dinanensis]PJR04580.1 osmotically inducible protein OsmC [Avrilella dinanensis]